MKKIAIILVAIMALLTFSSCEKLGGNIANTKWTFKLGNNNYVMEFTSKTDMRTYQCDSNYNFEDSLQEGTYEKDGNNITFGGEIEVISGSIWVPSSIYHITSGVISGDVLNIIATNSYGSTKEYTLMKL